MPLHGQTIIYITRLNQQSIVEKFIGKNRMPSSCKRLHLADMVRHGREQMDYDTTSNRMEWPSDERG